MLTGRERCQGSGRHLCVALAFTLAACGNETTSTPPQREIPDVSGNWNYQALDLTSATTDFECSVTGILSIAQTGSALSGQLSGTSIECQSPTQGFFSSGVGGGLANAEIQANGVVRFDVGGPQFHHEGSYSAASISMQGSVDLVENPGTVDNHIFSGSWSAKR